MVEIKLGGKNGLGKVALVDDEDADLASLSWWVAKGYAKRSGPRVGGKQREIPLHSLVIERALGRRLDSSQGLVTDHVNGDRLDNRRGNLRVVSLFQNALNKCRHADNSSGFKGVTWRPEKKQWHARIQLGGQIFRVGYFTDKATAAWMYDQWALALHGDYARTNFDYVPVDNS